MNEHKAAPADQKAAGEMMTFIGEVIDRFGGRPAGTDAERNAQTYFSEIASEVTDDVHSEPFRAPFGAKFTSSLYSPPSLEKPKQRLHVEHR